MEEKVINNLSCREITNVKKVYYIWYDNYLSIEKIKREELWRINKLNLKPDILPVLFNVDVDEWNWDESGDKTSNGGLVERQLKGFVPKQNEWVESYFNEMLRRPMCIFIETFDESVYLFGGESPRTTFTFTKSISSRNGYDLVFTCLSEESSLIINDEDFFPSPPDTGLTCDPVTINLDGTDILIANSGSIVTINLEDTDENPVIPDDVQVVGDNIKLVFPVAATPPTTGDYLVRFFDIDGTILKEEWVDAGNDATAPSNPTYDATYLTFAEWNQPFTNVQNDIDVGAIYDTIDGKTYLFLRITDTTGLQPTLQLNKSTADLMTINWGDGTTNTTTTNTNFTITKTAAYSAIGDYVVTIECPGLYGTNSSTGYLLGNNLTYSSTLLKIYMGINMRLNGIPFPNHRSLSVISINKNTAITNGAFSGCVSLIHVNLASTGTTINGCFVSCNSLKSISIPPNHTSITSGGFTNCRALKKIIAVSVTSWTGVQALENCYSLEELHLNNSLTVMGGFSFVRFCNSLKKLRIPTSLTTIDNIVFEGCISLTELEFPSSLTNVGANGAFAACTSILEYTFLSTTPPTNGSTGTFSGINAACKIYVPDASVAAYKAATNWTVVANYIYPLSTKP